MLDAHARDKHAVKLQEDPFRVNNCPRNYASPSYSFSLFRSICLRGFASSGIFRYFPLLFISLTTLYCCVAILDYRTREIWIDEWIYLLYHIYRIIFAIISIQVASYDTFLITIFCKHRKSDADFSPIANYEVEQYGDARVGGGGHCREGVGGTSGGSITGLSHPPAVCRCACFLRLSLSLRDRDQTSIRRQSRRESSFSYGRFSLGTNPLFEKEKLPTSSLSSSPKCVTQSARARQRQDTPLVPLLPRSPSAATDGRRGYFDPSTRRTRKRTA